VRLLNNRVGGASESDAIAPGALAKVKKKQLAACSSGSDNNSRKATAMVAALTAAVTAILHQSL